MKLYQRVSFALAVLTGIFIFCLSSISTFSCGTQEISLLSLIYHFSVFFLLGFFLFLSLGFNRSEFNLVVFALCFVYAALDELHQFFVPGRFCTLLDVFVDCLGVAASFAFIYFTKMCLD